MVEADVSSSSSEAAVVVLVFVLVVGACVVVFVLVVGACVVGACVVVAVVEVVGVLSNVVHRITKTNQPFTMGEIEDFGSKRTFLAFNSPAYPKMIEHIKDDVIVKLKVKVKLRNSEVSLMLEETTLLNHQLVEKVCHVDLLENQSMEQLHEIKQACLMNRGQIPIVFHVQQTVIKTNKKYWIKDTAISVLESILGEQKVWLEN